MSIKTTNVLDKKVAFPGSIKTLSLFLSFYASISNSCSNKTHLHFLCLSPDTLHNYIKTSPSLTFYCHMLLQTVPHSQLLSSRNAYLSRGAVSAICPRHVLGPAAPLGALWTGAPQPPTLGLRNTHKHIHSELTLWLDKIIRQLEQDMSRSYPYG